MRLAVPDVVQVYELPASQERMLARALGAGGERALSALITAVFGLWAALATNLGGIREWLEDLWLALRRTKAERLPGRLVTSVAVFWGRSSRRFVNWVLGLAGSELALSLRETGWILLARSPDGSIWRTGPFFWAMHTAFLPTLFFLLVIAAAWLAKIVAVVLGFLLRRGSHEEINPLGLTTALLGAITAILGAVAAGAAYMLWATGVTG